MAKAKPTSRTETKPAIIRPRRLAELLDVHLSTIYRWHEEGNMPIKKIKIGPATVGYRRDDVEALLNGELQDEEV